MIQLSFEIANLSQSIQVYEQMRSEKIVVYQEHHKAEDHGQIGGIVEGGHYPQHGQYNVVGGIANGVVGRAQIG